MVQKNVDTTIQVRPVARTLVIKKTTSTTVSVTVCNVEVNKKCTTSKPPTSQNLALQHAAKRVPGKLLHAHLKHIVSALSIDHIWFSCFEILGVMHFSAAPLCRLDRQDVVGRQVRHRRFSFFRNICWTKPSFRCNTKPRVISRSVGRLPAASCCF